MGNSVDYRTVSKADCSLEGDYSSEGSVKEAFQGWVSLDTQEQSRAGLN